MCLLSPQYKGLRIVLSESDVPESEDFVTVRLEEGARVLQTLDGMYNNSRRFVTDRKGKMHEVKMAFCCNPGCQSVISAPCRAGTPLIDATGLYGIELRGISPYSCLKHCGSCKNTQYCGRACQKEHWKEHKLVCGELGDYLRDSRPSRNQMGPPVSLDRDSRGMPEFTRELSFLLYKELRS